jgi:hypothetical protein
MAVQEVEGTRVAVSQQWKCLSCVCVQLDLQTFLISILHGDNEWPDFTRSETASGAVRTEGYFETVETHGACCEQRGTLMN